MDFEERIDFWKNDLKERYYNDLEHYCDCMSDILDLAKEYTDKKVLDDLRALKKQYKADMFAYDTIANMSRLFRRTIATTVLKPMWAECLNKKDYCTFIKLLNTEESKFINENYSKLEDIRIAMLAELEEVRGLFKNEIYDEVEENEI